MAYEKDQDTLSLPAGEDLTAKQFRFVKFDTDGTVIACTATTDRPARPGPGRSRTLLAANTYTEAAPWRSFSARSGRLEGIRGGPAATQSSFKPRASPAP